MSAEIVTELENARGEVRNVDEAVFDAAASLNCDPHVLGAIVNVESSGDWYDLLGRLIILPEKATFYKRLASGLRKKALALGLAAATWSPTNYKGLGGPGSDQRWSLLMSMAAIDEDAALSSTSYGGPQIMGFNHQLCGYPTVSAFVLAMAESNTKQIAALVAYLEAVGLVADIRAKDFTAIARRYNGSGQVAAYADRLRRAYEARAGKPAGVAATRSGSLRMGTTGFQVEALQKRLVDLQYHVAIDGDFGPATERAVAAFQKSNGLTADGIVGPKTLAALERAVPVSQHPGNSRDALKVKDLRNRGSQTIAHADTLTKVGGATIAGGVLSEAAKSPDTFANLPGLDQVNQVTGLIYAIQDPLRPVFAFIGDHPLIGLALVGGVVLFVAWRIKQRRLSDAKTWRHVG
ncbi:MAG: DUF3380 domain-containing protein [Alphaproteobacteria bacterium]|nr:DUF3380 domain-containing protein [Alphaproteobacteria bacterium]